MFVLLFSWACWINYTIAHNGPEEYLNYAEMSLKWYSDFIKSWFKDNITIMVTLISIGQGLIALGMLLNGWWIRLACIGVIVFLICIAPLGVGFSISLFNHRFACSIFHFKKDDLNYLWKFKQNEK